MSHTTVLPAEPGSARLARDVVRRMCADNDITADDVDTAVLLTSELVANAIRHAPRPSVLDASIRDRRLCVTVTDRSHRAPRIASPRSSTAEPGRGLVSKLAHRWGYEPTGTGKKVWFELDLE
jgi:anti-sigma regulatory factor (Ser/Thr protein kinase)